MQIKVLLDDIGLSKQVPDVLQKLLLLYQQLHPTSNTFLFRYIQAKSLTRIAASSEAVIKYRPSGENLSAFIAPL